MIRALVGPTATGKTAIACDIAEHLGAEIICCDSMTIYRGMDIGTAKPSAADRARVRHHLLDVADPGEGFTVARFQRLARAALEHIEHPLLVGGSGLYYQAVVDELTFPPTDEGVRARLEAEPVDELVQRLTVLDPVAAGFVDPANKRRVVRALEVIELTGEPFSSFRSEWERRRDPANAEALVVAGLDAPNEVLKARIEARARGMLAAGVIEEVRALVAGGFRDALTASQAVGYRQAIEVLDGTADDQSFVERTTAATMRLVRRQRAWFSRDPRIVWFDVAEPADARARIQAYFSGHP